jgi:archaellum component FlaG (FlaF/FlaG flagellin family)
MPSRHISPQSFDSILSELGDDPAIPDPHGIRKRNPPNPPPQNQPSTSKVSANFEAISNQNPLTHLKKFAPLLGLGGACIALGIVCLMAYKSIESGNQTDLDESQRQISELKKEFAILRNEITEIEESLYESIDLLEVSIHSFSQIKPNVKAINKPKSIPHEAELRNWRYLGLSQTKGSHQAFFHNGKTNVMVENGSVVLGDWVLHSFSRESATLTHPQGKSLHLKPSKSE